MDLFKERLKETGKTIIGVAAILLVIGIISGLFTGILWTLNWIWEPLDDIAWALVVLSFLGYFIIKGIYWQFIEPFRKKKELEEE